KADLWLMLFLPFCFMDFNNYIAYFYFLLIVTAIFMFIQTRDVPQADNAAFSSLVVCIVVTVVATMSAPYSKSYLLFSLPAIILLLTRRFKTTLFWALVALLTFIPMLLNYRLRGKPPFILLYKHGYYRSHIRSLDNQYNDFGFNSVKRYFHHSVD
ncbi:MAG TPA: hypothetical protein PK876_10005, partial [Elusimicrobiota bacterium]|nr:hypothetical protein [Elusimicrobiota bacterium]